jgi:hypothetical protein
MCIALGDFEGGALVVKSADGTKIEHKTRNTWVEFDGNDLHWTTPFLGDRYSLIFFTHTFGKKKQIAKNPDTTQDPQVL